MSLLIALIIGAVTGAVAGSVMKENYDLLLMNSVFGIAGGLIGLGVYAVTASGEGSALLSLTAIVFEVIAATLAVLLFNFVHKTAPEKTNVISKGEGK